MPPTSVPLIALALLGTAMVIAATVWVWRLTCRLRVLPRMAGILLVEASLLISAGLVVNRQEDFYPTWDALVAPDSVDLTSPAYRTIAGRLDDKLAARTDGSRGGPQALRWMPAGWTRWQLTGPPMLVVPAGCLQHPQWHYSVVVVVASAAAWPQAAALRVAVNARRDVVVVVNPGPGATVQTLTTEVPERLNRDLRVSGHRWAIVAVAGQASLVHQAVLHAPALYPAVATVESGDPALVAPSSTAVGNRAAHSRPRLPDGIATFNSRSDQLVTAVSGAVRWAGDQTPPPLAASSPPIRYLPVKHRRRSHVAVGSSISSDSDDDRDNGYGPRQRRH